MKSPSINIKSGDTLAGYLGDFIRESVKATLQNKTLQEKEKQSALAPDTNTDNSQAASGGSQGSSNEKKSGGDSGAEKPTPSKTHDEETEKLKQGNIEPKDIIEKLNSIRSGKSFKDDNISNAMDEYIGSLSKEEKVALLAFLKGISQIVTGEIPAQQAQDPSDNPSDIKMQKGHPTQVKHIKPNVIKTSAPIQKEKKKPEEEDTSSPKETPAPIAAKKR